ncbi:MAG: MFS transporter [Myxococcaceae bacterium]|nr:MFS transporter [Myxococcaceae bacterium]
MAGLTLTARSLGRALRHRNYRLFFAGQSLSLIGTWLTRVATSWLVFRLTHSEWLLGVSGFASQIPIFFLAPFAGVWVDRLNRHRVLVVTQVMAMIQSGLLAIFALTGTITVVHVILLNLLQGVINSFDMPARQAFVVQMIEDRADLPNAIALNSSMVNAARLIGPTVGGALIATVGEGWCFAIDALSYVAVIGSLLAMRLVTPAPRQTTGHVLEALREGAGYAARSKPIRALLLLLSVSSLLGMPYMVLMPAMAEQALRGGANTFGVMMAATGAGALVGALYLASRSSVLGLGKVVALSAAGFGVGLAVFAGSRWLWLTLPALGLTGLSMMTQTASTNTLLQTIVDEDKRGRVMSFYTVAIVGTAPFGSLFAGALADRFGAPTALLIGGAGCLLGAIAFLRALPRLRVHVRPIYERLGILSVTLPQEE